MEIRLVAGIASSINEKLDGVKQLTNLLPQAQKLEELFRRWPEQGLQPRVSAWSCLTLAVNLDVDRMSDVEALLAFLEIGLNIDFDRTDDMATANLAFRKFESRQAPWLRVDAILKQDGPGCRKVITGYTKPQPIYKIECLNEIDPPEQLAAPASQVPALEGPDDDIPF